MLDLVTGCRLHFGLLELAARQPHRYGGLGLMLDWPRVHLRASVARSASVSAGEQRWITKGMDAEFERRMALVQSHAAGQMSSSAAESRWGASGETWTIELLECPPLHSGFGVGTQFSAAIALLTRAIFERANQPAVFANNLPAMTVAELAQWTGRGKRSAIGLHGFLHGGLVQDAGYIDIESASLTPVRTGGRPVSTSSCALPAEWRMVLITSQQSSPTHGEQEDLLIERASRNANLHRDDMLLLSDRCVDAARHRRFDLFVAWLEHYMDLAADLFVAVQGGKYRDAATDSLVCRARSAGLRAVGQSSWGPTVFGFAAHPAEAQECAGRLEASVKSEGRTITIARARNEGASLTVDAGVGAQHAG